MNYTYLHYEIGLTHLNGVGPRKARKLLEHFKTAENIFNSPRKLFCEETGISRATYDQLGFQNALKKAEDIVQEHHNLGVETLSWTNENYPRRLRQCEDAPLVLYKRGACDLNNGKFLAVVGTRDASSYGRKLVNNLIESLKEQQITIVSGLAHGIDTIAHQRTLHENMKTIAVLGHGLDRIYPALNKSLARSIEENGALVTEFAPWSLPDRENFPKRNRIVAGMCDATIVVESRAKGGSLITAELSNDYNRDVFAFPGNVSSERSKGCNKLISQQKAHLITSGKEFLEIMGWDKTHSKKGVQRIAFPKLNAIQESIVRLLENENNLPIDVISYKTALSISQINVELLHLEMGGIVESLPGKKFNLL